MGERGNWVSVWERDRERGIWVWDLCILDGKENGWGMVRGGNDGEREGLILILVFVYIYFLILVISVIIFLFLRLLVYYIR